MYPQLVLFHFGLAGDGGATEVADEGSRVLVLGGVAVVHPSDVVVQIGQVGELLGGLAIFLTDLALPIALFHVDSTDVLLDPRRLDGGKRALFEHAKPLAWTQRG